MSFMSAIGMQKGSSVAIATRWFSVRFQWWTANSCMKNILWIHLQMKHPLWWPLLTRSALSICGETSMNLETVEWMFFWDSCQLGNRLIFSMMHARCLLHTQTQSYVWSKFTFGSVLQWCNFILSLFWYCTLYGLVDSCNVFTLCGLCSLVLCFHNGAPNFHML